MSWNSLLVSGRRRYSDDVSTVWKIEVPHFKNGRFHLKSREGRETRHEFNQLTLRRGSYRSSLLPLTQKYNGVLILIDFMNNVSLKESHQLKSFGKILFFMGTCIAIEIWNPEFHGSRFLVELPVNCNFVPPEFIFLEIILFLVYIYIS